MQEKFKVPTEMIELPSKGKLYPEGSELSKGVVEMSYMTAKHEDVLTNVNLLRKGTAIETVLKGPAGFSTALEEVKNQLANDSRQQMTAMQQQIDRMDALVTAMQDNAEYSRRIANEMA